MTDILGEMKKALSVPVGKITRDGEFLRKGEGPGHPFRGNQHTSGSGGGGDSHSVAASHGWKASHTYPSQNEAGHTVTVFGNRGSKGEALQVSTSGHWSHEGSNSRIAEGRGSASLKQHLESYKGKK